MAARMQQYMSLSIVLAVGLIAILLSAGCGGVRGTTGPGFGLVNGSGQLVTRDMNYADFTEVEIGNAARLEVVRSDGFGVSITADDNLFDYIEVNKQGERLSIKLREGTGYNNTTLRARVAMPDLRGLNLSGAANGTVDGFKSSNNTKLELSGASRLSGRIEAGDFGMNISGASNLTLAGTGGKLALDASGASRASLDDLAVNDAQVRLSGASNATVNARGRVDADASGASNLTYVGNPTMGNVNTSGASSVKRK